MATSSALTMTSLARPDQSTPQPSQSAVTVTPFTQTQTPSPIPTETIGATHTRTPTAPPTMTIGPTDTSTPGLGTIAGAISGYPYGSVPSFAIVAFEQEAPFRYWYLLIPSGSSYYSMDGYITTGNYLVVAYDSSGHSGGCTSIVQVKSNQTVNCDVTNWGGGYPAKPSGVPTP